jgi:hypothetical protein
MLTGKTEKDKQLQTIIKNIISTRPPFTTASGKKAFSNEYEELVPYSLSNQYYSILVGMGFDYLARFIIAQNLENIDVKESVYRHLAAGRGLKRLESMTENKLYKTLVRKYENGIEVCERFVNNEKSDFDEILNFSGYLASLETVARSGMPPLDIKKSLIDDTNIEIINDLRALCNVFKDKFINSSIINEDEDVVFNPHFGVVVSHCVGGADADIFINGTLYDFKCTKSRGYTWIECAQIVGYYLLNTIDIRCGGNGMGFDEFGSPYEIDRLAFYRGRHGEIEGFDVRLLDENKLEQGIEDLRKMWDLKF